MTVGKRVKVEKEWVEWKPERFALNLLTSLSLISHSSLSSIATIQEYSVEILREDIPTFSDEYRGAQWGGFHILWAARCSVLRYLGILSQI